MTSLGIDVGGTFTDIVAHADDGEPVLLKVATTPGAPEQGALRGVARLLERRPGMRVAHVFHSTTIATNALLGQMQLELPRVALLTTDGFRDVIEIGRQNRSELYDLNVTRPEPLVARADRFPIRERLNADGSVLVPLDLQSVRAAAATLREQNITTIAIGFLHAYVNADHERRAAETLHAELPEATISCSSEIDPAYREFERFSTTVVNAALAPLVRRYVEALECGLRDLGVDAPLFVMQSNGGAVAARHALRRPAALIESGPASGIVGVAALAREIGIERALGFDMGGTTAKAGTVVGGEPEVATEFEAAGRTHSGRTRRGSGFPVRFPFVDLAEVSAGGGTIAWLDGEALRVGPLSAGADPGPACYGKSERPTVTDANVVLGRLNPVALLGGAFPIEAGRSHDAIGTLARKIGRTVEETASAIITLVDGEMAKVLRIVTIERGNDPRDFTLVAYGGNGPLHAASLAEELEIQRVLVPPSPGLFSASGMLTADLRAYESASLLHRADAIDDVYLDGTFRALERRVADLLREQGAGGETIRCVRTCAMRYDGQSFELPVPWSGDVATAVAAFHRKHATVYGYSLDDEPVEFVQAQVTGMAPVGARVAGRRAPFGNAPPQRRRVWLGGAHGTGEIPVYEGSRPSIAGPAVVEQYDATIYVPPNWTLHSERDGRARLEHDRRA